MGGAVYKTYQKNGLLNEEQPAVVFKFLIYYAFAAAKLALITFNAPPALNHSICCSL